MGNTSGIKWNGINDAGTLQSSYEIILRDTKTNNEEKILLPDFFDQAITLGFISTNSGWSLTGNAGTAPNVNFLGTTDGKNLIIQPDSGNVGVGNDTPAFKLDVTDDSQAFAPYLQVGIDAGDPYCFIGNREGGDNLSYAEFTVSDFNIVSKALADVMSIQGRAEYITISNAGEEISRFDGATGNVGIGTTSPLGKLHVEGGSIIGNFTNDDGTVKYNLIGQNSDNSIRHSYEQSVIGLGLTFEDDNTSSASILLINTDIQLNTAGANNVIIQSTGSNGNVGIGTLSPASKLTVDGDTEVLGSANGVILVSPDNTRYRVTVANGGTLTVTAV